MKIGEQKNHPFKGVSPYNVTLALENNVLLNKALFDVTASDVPWVIMANNKEERRERINRSLVSFSLIFASPLVILPLVNRLAMKNVAKLTPQLFSKEYNAIRLSYGHLSSAEKTKVGFEELSKSTKIDFQPLINRFDGDYEKIRQKIINAKNTVLGSDILLVAGTFGNIGFFNDWQTRKKTGQIGYSAEMEMADKKIVEKRAEKYERTRNLKFASYLTLLATVATTIPIAIKHGLTSKNGSKFNNFIKRHAPKFDYTNAIFAKRLPLAISLAVSMIGINLASRNKTELKDNAIRSSLSWSIFWGGDLIMASLLARLSDKILKTKIVKRDNNNKLLNKFLPPIKSLKELKNIDCPKSKNIAVSIFWINFTFLSALSGFGIPYFINKIVKKDVSKDVEKASYNKSGIQKGQEN